MTDEQDKELNEIVGYVIKTHEIDESGDASFFQYMDEMEETWKAQSATDMFKDYLEWSNGKNWKVFLDHAQIGDTPPK